MNLAAAVLHVLLALAPSADASEQTRLADVAAAISSTASTVDDAALLLAIGQHESGFRRDIDLGLKRGSAGECGIWQVMPGSLGPCSEVVGDRTAQALRALRLARASRARCGHGDTALAAYASGRCDRGLVESAAMVHAATKFAARLAAVPSS